MARQPESPEEREQRGARETERTERENLQDYVPPNDLCRIKHSDAYDHEQTFGRNIEDLLMSALRGNYRTWYLDAVRAKFKSNNKALKYLPEKGEKPQEHHIDRKSLDSGQILFFDRNGREITAARVDITDVFLERDALYKMHGLDEYTKWRRRKRQEELRRLQRETGKNYDAMFLAVQELGFGPKAPKRPRKKVDLEETIALRDVLSDIDAIHEERTGITRTFARTIERAIEKREKEKSGLPVLAPLFDNIATLFKNDYDITLKLNADIAAFTDDDWSAQGKWKYVEGRREVEKLFTEIPPKMRSLPYPDFLKNIADKLHVIDSSVLDEMTGNFPQDLEKFTKFARIVHDIERGRKTAKSYKFIWEHRNDYLRVWKLLDDYSKTRQERIYSVNPFRLHGWNVDDLRRVVQEGSNSEIRFDDVAEHLYNKNFDSIRQALQRDGVPESLVLRLRGEDIEEDFMTFRKIVRESKGDELEKAREVYRVLGDYVAYSVRLVRLVEKLRYKPPRRLAEGARQMEGGDIFRVNASDNADMRYSKSVLRSIFMEEVGDPERYYTSGEWMWKFLSGDDPKERAFTMRDFNGRVYSVERPWFRDYEMMTKYQTGSVAYKLAYEHGREPGTPESQINVSRVTERLRHFLELGLSAYGMRLDDSFEDLLERNGVTRRGIDTEDVRGLRDSLMKQLDAFLSDFRKGRKSDLSPDVLAFIRIGSVVSYRNRVAEKEREKRYSVKVKMSETDAARITDSLRAKEKKFTEAELLAIKEGLTAGFVMTDNSAGLGLAQPLPHGYSMNIGVGLADDFSTLATGASVGKNIAITDKFSLTVYGGGAVSGGGAMPGAGVVLNYTFDAQSAYIAAAGTPAGLYVGLGAEERQDIATQKSIDRAFLEKNIYGAKGLEKFAPEGRYVMVKNDPESYPEFAEILHALSSFGFDDASQAAIFESYYQLYKQELKSQSTRDSFLVFRGMGIGGTVSLNPAGFLEFLFPFKFGVAKKTLVFRIAETEDVETWTDLRTREKLQYADKKAAEKVETQKTVRFQGEIQFDRDGYLVLAKARGGALELLPPAEHGLRGALEKNADIEVGSPNREGLIPLQIKGAYGEIHINIAPEVKDDAVLVTDGNTLYLSIRQGTDIYVTREDINYPFPREGVTEQTYVTISRNKYRRRRGPGGIEAKAPNFLRKFPGTSWEIIQNKEFKGKLPIQIFTLGEYRKLLSGKTKFKTERITAGRLEKRGKALHALAKTLSEGSYEAESMELPAHFEKDLAFLKTDEAMFMRGFRDRMTRALESEDAKHHMPALYAFIKQGFAEQAADRGDTTPPEMNELALEHALTELVIASFQNIQETKDPEKAFHHYLETFERPLLTSLFEKYYREKGLSDSDAKKKGVEAAHYLVTQMKGVVHYRTGTKRGEPMKRGSIYAFLAGMRGHKGKLRGIRTLMNPSESADPYGVFYPANNEYLLDASSPLRREIARFWVEHMSPIPDMSRDGAFRELLEFAETREGDPRAKQKVHEALRTPDALKLAMIFAETSLRKNEIAELDKAFQGRVSIDADTAMAATVEKFLQFCWQVRRAQLDGKKEMKIEGTHFTLLLDQKILMGVYAKCGNIAAVSEHGGNHFAVRDDRKEGRILVVRQDGIIDSSIGNGLISFGLLGVPGFTMTKGSETPEGTPEESPEEPPVEKEPPGEVTLGPPESPEEPPPPVETPEKPKEPSRESGRGRIVPPESIPPA